MLYTAIVFTVVVGAVCSGMVINIGNFDKKKYSDDTFLAGKKDHKLVAFSVAYTNTFNPSKDARIMFNHVHYNDGNHYDHSTGQFRVPFDGVYAIYFGASGTKGKYTYLRLYAGNPEVQIATSYDYNTNHPSPSGFVIRKLKRGDTVSVFLAGGQAIHNQSPPSNFFTEKGNQKLVAFSVFHSEAFSPSKHARIMFNHVQYNDGNHYDQTTGQFRVPFDGVYAIYFGASGDNGKATHMFLYAGNPEVKIATAYDYNPRHPSPSGFVIRKLSKGDTVSVFLNGGSALQKHDTPNNYFTGYLISTV